MTAPSGIVQKILKGDYCTGCGLCAAVSRGAIDMQMMSPGYLRPVQHGKLAAETEALIADVCPGIHLHQTSTEGVNHPLWGPIIAVRTGAACDPALRQHASSGGVLSALARFLLETRQVDFVLQIAASEEHPIENSPVMSFTAEDIYRAAGSRYGPAAPLKDIEHHLASPGRFAVVGKPCDIAGLRSLARHDPRVDEKVPYMLSFFCAGVPSLEGTKQILKRLNVSEDELQSFRYRGDGWPGQAVARTKNDREAGMSYSESWGNILSHHVQFRCKICPDGSGGFADLACGDAWECDESGYPNFEEKDGLSLILTRTARGEALVKLALTGGHIVGDSLPITQIKNIQPSQARKKSLILSRLIALLLLRHNTPLFKGFKLVRSASFANLSASIRSFAGLTKRLLLHSR